MKTKCKKLTILMLVLVLQAVGISHATLISLSATTSQAGSVNYETNNDLAVMASQWLWEAKVSDQVFGIEMENTWDYRRRGVVREFCSYQVLPSPRRCLASNCTVRLYFLGEE